MTTVASVLPAFLTGALGVQLRDALGFDATGLGFAVASFFVVGVVGSAALGRLGERLGARHAMTIGLCTTILANLVIATWADRWLTLAIPLMAAGAANALNQTAANSLLGRTSADDRLIFS
ncbi:MAG: MFS transporter, partial [Acidimicrobiia bacterium]|nr:MFS transporter [Acidimicrobiia bacterium]